MKKHVSILALIALVLAFVTFSGVASAQPTSVQITLFTQPMCAYCQQVDPIVHSVAAANPGATLVVHDTSTAEGKGVAQANNVMSTPTIIITKNGQQTFRSNGRVVSAAELQAALSSILPKILPKIPQPPVLPKVNYPTTPVKPMIQLPKVQPFTVKIPANVATSVTKHTTVTTKTMSAKYPAGAAVVTKHTTVAKYPAGAAVVTKHTTVAKYPAGAAVVTKHTTVSTKPQTYAQPQQTYAQPQQTKQPPIEVVSTPPTQTQNAPASTVPEFSLLGLGAPALLVGAIYLFMRRM